MELKIIEIEYLIKIPSIRKEIENLKFSTNFHKLKKKNNNNNRENIIIRNNDFLSIFYFY